LSKIFRHFRANDPARVRDVFATAGLNIQAQRKLMGRFLLVTAGIA
jgi:hypothetical protein